MNPISFLSTQLMMPILNFFNGLTHSYGLAIILLTIVIRGAIFPLSMKQYQSMRAMQELQPRLKELQAQFKDKPQELNQAMMGFYSENKVNPFGSCLPLIVQMPFLIALYSTLIGKEFQDQVGHQSFLFIQDLTAVGVIKGGLHWDNALMVAVFGITTFITQKMMMTDPKDPMQAQMLYMMPIMITSMFVFFPLPSGVLLYTVFSNFFTMGQYLILQRVYPKAPTPPAAGATIDVSATNSKL